MCLSYRSDRGISINYLYGGKSSTKGQRALVWCLGMGSSPLEPLSIKKLGYFGLPMAYFSLF